MSTTLRLLGVDSSVSSIESSDTTEFRRREYAMEMDWFTLSAILTVLGILTYLGKVPSVARNLYTRTPFGRRRLLYRDLAMLATGLQADEVTTILGKPRFKNEKQSYRELTYEKRDCFVQVITDTSDTILLYAVTARNSKFHAPTWVTRARWSPRPVPEDSRLGRFGFDEIASLEDPPNGIMGWCGANRWRYIESYWYGRPGNFQKFILALNDAGHVWGADSLPQISRVFLGTTVQLGDLLWVDRRPRAENESQSEEPDDQEERIQEFLQRSEVQDWRRMKPNTYAIAAPNVDIADLIREVHTVGPDADQVGLLPSMANS